MTRALLICDDDPAQLDELTALFQECPPWHQWPVQCFSSTQALLAHQDTFSPGSIRPCRMPTAAVGKASRTSSP